MSDHRLGTTTLCIGLDMAWFGGSSRDPWSQHDCLAAAWLDERDNVLAAEIRRINLPGRDPKAETTAHAIEALISESNPAQRLVLAVDAPLQAARRPLPDRNPVPRTSEVERRACDVELNRRRVEIDQTAGGANGWHPNVQPGAPIPCRITHLLNRLPDSFRLWSQENASHPSIIIECFPAEAIWAAKRLGHYPAHFTATRAKAYKAQKGVWLTAEQIRAVVEDALLHAFKFVTTSPEEWEKIVNQVIDWMLKDATWQKNGRYRGGKMLDDVVDSTICLATAIAYAGDSHHAWQDSKNPDDGHIIGPGILTYLFRNE